MILRALTFATAMATTAHNATATNVVKQCKLFPRLIEQIAAPCLEAGTELSAHPKIVAARKLLVRHGFATDAEFKDLAIRECRFKPSPIGQISAAVPSENMILMSEDFAIRSLSSLTRLLGHELVHIRQRRLMGSFGYDCLYGKYMTERRGHGDANPIEKEAYALGRRIETRLTRPRPHSQTRIRRATR